MNFLVSILLSLLPSLIWLLFYLAEDERPEPKKLIAKVFLAGAISALVAFLAENVIVFLLNQVDARCMESRLLICVLSLVAIEEISKFAAVYLVVRKNPAFDEPIDAMIYMVVGALGFATLENIGAIAFGQAGEALTEAFEMAVLRFVGATLLHSLSSGVLGYFWVLDIRRFQTKKFVFLGFVLATVLHTIFNILIINYSRFFYILAFLIIISLWVLHYFEKLKQKAI